VKAVQAFLASFYLVGSLALGAEPLTSDDSNAAFERIETTFRNAGAPATALTRFETEWRQLWPQEQKDYAEYVLGLKSADLQKDLERMSQVTPDDQYVRGPDYIARPDVPKGSILELKLDHSTLFPGTQHEIRVYVPANYRGERPTCVHVQLDGLVFGMQTVFDNLIQQHEIPPMIAIGIKPGVVNPVDTHDSKRHNRSLEFDGLSDDLARFVLEEVFPAVEQLHTPDGTSIRLSRDPNDHSIAGVSTGGIGSFTVAWQRPDAFRRVYTGIGTFVGMRGGDRYPVLVRKTEPKPLRIFMQDGSHDELDDWLGEVGDWRLSNLTMLSALEFAGYSVEHVWGEGSHNGNQAVALFPQAMRWLWKDWPTQIVAATSHNNLLKDIVIPGQSWERVSSDNGGEAPFLETPRGYRAISPQRREYFTDTHTGQVWLTRAGAKPLLMDSGLKAPTGVAVSPDGAWLAVAESKTHWGYSYRIEPNGTLTARQRFYWFHVPDEADDSGTGGWVMDRDGRLYAATRLGVQVFDHNGRVRAIIPVPGGAISSIAFGGPDLTTLFVRTVNHTVFRRTMRVPGARPGGKAVSVPDWGAG
jgi:gluconolactonase